MMAQFDMTLMTETGPAVNIPTMFLKCVPCVQGRSCQGSFKLSLAGNGFYDLLRLCISFEAVHSICTARRGRTESRVNKCLQALE